MNKRIGRVLAVSAAFVLLAFSSGCKKDQYTLNFNHNLHVVENEMDCSDCHIPSTAATMGRPDHGICADCHDIEEDNPSPDCLECHNADNADQIKVRRPERPGDKELLFSHEKHQYMDASCQDCHAKAAASVSAKENVLPSKEACLSCHDDETAPQKDCAVCHVESSPVNATHRLDWEAHHGLESKMSNSNCLACHSEDSCIECHQDKKPQDHNNTWRRITHGAEAGWNRTRCMSCHEEDFCDRCHDSTRPRSHKSAGWSSGPTQHCSQCHIPANAVGCSVCHKDSDHETATDSPHPPFEGFVCEACHPSPAGVFPPHQDPGVSCTICHER